MRTLQISVAITCALALGGCLDNNSGPHDQWMNTDAYVAPPDAAIGDGGTVTPTCGDAGPAFTAPTQVSVDPGADAGVTAVQSDVALVALASGQRLLAWVDRSLATAGSASLVVGRVSAGAAPGTTTAITQPAACAALVAPTLAVTADGTVVLAGVCLGSSELAPSSSDIVVFRSTDGGQTFGAGVTVAACPATSTQCSHPSLAASGTAVDLAYASEDLTPPSTVTAGRIVVLHSDDDGVTFPTATLVTDSNADVAAPRIAYAASGVLHLVYTGFPTLGGPGYIFYAQRSAASLADGGVADAGQADAGQVDAGQVDAGQVDAGADDAGADDAGVSDGGLTPAPFAGAQNLGPGHDPDVAVAADGVVVVWAAQGYVEQSHAGADGTFSTPLPVDVTLGAVTVLAPRVAVRSGTLHLFWLAGGGATGGGDAGVAGAWTAVYSRSADGATTWSAPLTVAGPFDGDPTSERLLHRLGPVGISADSTGVVAAWGDPDTLDPSAGATNVYVAALACE
jgi:hypothetical protein